MGLTQEKMAERLGVSRISYDNWEKGKLSPTPKHWDVIQKEMCLRFMLVAVPVQSILTEGNYHFATSDAAQTPQIDDKYKKQDLKNWQLSRVKTPFTS